MSEFLQAHVRSVCLGANRVLGDIQLAFDAGRWIAVVGPNGAGKSTLLRTLAGLQRADGDIRLQGQSLSRLAVRDRARQIAWFGVDDVAADELRAIDLVMLGRLPHRPWLAPPSQADRAAVERAMHSMQVGSLRERAIGSLSSGERQRVLIARALAVEAPIVLMDEPLAHLDPPHQADWINVARTLARQGRLVISALHELNAALQADELLVMQAGKALHRGAAHDASTREALQSVFDHRLRFGRIDEAWSVVTC